MEKRRVLVVVVMATLGALMMVITPSNSATVERSDHHCGKYKDDTWATCDSGRCCSIFGFCGDTGEYCNDYFCNFQCHQVPIPPADGDNDDQSSNTDDDDDTGGSGGGVLLHIRLVNATHNNNNYSFTRDDDDDDLVKEVAISSASSSSSSSSSSLSSSPLISCATFLSRLPLASRHKYPFAALRAASMATRDTNITTHCGRCLKVTNLGVGGLYSQVKVRIVYERNSEGLELDMNTFNKLDTDGRGIAEGHLLVKYEFENC